MKRESFAPAGTRAAEAAQPLIELSGITRAFVNGEVETRRGRQLRDGDIVEADGERLRVVAQAGA